MSYGHPHIISGSLLLLHYYAEDSELYVFLFSSTISTVLNFMDCLSSVVCWMSDNRFQLTDSKSGMTSDLYFGEKKSWKFVTFGIPLTI